MHGDMPVRFGEGLAKTGILRKAQRRHSTPQEQPTGSFQCGDGSRFRPSGIVCCQPHLVHLASS